MRHQLKNICDRKQNTTNKMGSSWPNHWSHVGARNTQNCEQFFQALLILAAVAFVSGIISIFIGVCFFGMSLLAWLFSSIWSITNFDGEGETSSWEHTLAHAFVFCSALLGIALVSCCGVM